MCEGVVSAIKCRFSIFVVRCCQMQAPPCFCFKFYLVYVILVNGDTKCVGDTKFVGDTKCVSTSWCVGATTLNKHVPYRNKTA